MNAMTAFLVVVCFAAGVAAVAFWHNLIVAFACVTAGVITAMSLKMTNVWQKFVILRMEKLRSVKEAGLLVIIAGATCSVAQASPPDADGSRLYAPCVVCHQPNAGGSTDGNIPSLAGQQRRYLEKQLAAFRSGARDDTAMQIVAVHSTFSDPRNTRALAEYLSVLAANPSPVMGSGEHVRLGQELYTHICAACHGSDGLGQSGNRVPRLAGQHYPYLRRQIEAAAALHRDLAPPEMTSALRGMRAPEKDALADYISRLGSSGS